LALLTKFKNLFSDKEERERERKLIQNNNNPDILRDYFFDTWKRIREIETRPNCTDICIGAAFDHPKDSAWMVKQFKLMNHFYKRAYIHGWNLSAYRMRYYQNGRVEELEKARLHNLKRNMFLKQAYKLVTAYENNILRAHNDQTCAVKPIQTTTKADLVTNFGLTIMIENFMVFNNLRFDMMDAGTGDGDPYGGDKQLQAITTSVSIPNEGYAIPYGVEARHGAPFLASVVTADVAEVGIRDSVSGRLYSRSVFPEDRIIEHEKDFDAYSINHITQLKAI
jgi:hypothetical protein